MTDSLSRQLVDYIEDAHALEQQMERQLATWISATEDPHLLEGLTKRKEATVRHQQTLRSRLEAHGAEPATVKEGAGALTALGKGLVDKVRSDDAGKVNRDGLTSAALEIASFELLSRVARRAADEETAEAAEVITAEVREVFEAIDGDWDHVADISLAQEGVVA